MTTPHPLLDQPEWQSLTAHCEALRNLDIRQAFIDDAERHQRLEFTAAGLTVDFSKQSVLPDTLQMLVALAQANALPAKIASLFAGADVNGTEQRPALHMALRDFKPEAIEVGGTDIKPLIADERKRLHNFIQNLHDHHWLGFRGDAITDVVNLGIGGSDLGPKLVADALRLDAPRRCRVHFAANVDGGELLRILGDLDPATTLFIVASKSFTTPETLLNATTAREWLLAAASGNRSAIARHFVAVSANKMRAVEFGIDERNIFSMWDWVGGRYSVWSSIGLPVMCAYGTDVFHRLLRGANLMDEHFRTTPLAQNVPVLMGLLGIWHGNLRGAQSWAMVPYDDRLFHLPAYLQQLEMESNGKRVRNDGSAVEYATAPVVWGGLGTNAQHAFFQLLHQGTQLIPLDFVVALNHPISPRAHHDALVANCFAQSEALLRGKRFAEAFADSSHGNDQTHAEHLARHRTMPGNRPHTLIVVDELKAETMGALLALYEHKTFVQGAIWDINPFDQWGVELGKKMAATILGEFDASGPTPAHDASTSAWIARYRQRRGD
ncbi:MAG: glucose-6-phosphate isomerase [Gammaproteobacteria bacterium]|nr:glucose-6-phosphate isomerase [Gammaproteobacteria bacterium]